MCFPPCQRSETFTFEELSSGINRFEKQLQIQVVYQADDTGPQVKLFMDTRKVLCCVKLGQ